jgi:hypothetical protein
MENIQREITETVNEYLNNGYLLEFSNYSSNTEKCHFFLRKNRTFVKVWFEDIKTCLKETKAALCKLRLAEYTTQNKEEFINMKRFYKWEENIIMEREFFQLYKHYLNDNMEVYSDSLEEAQEKYQIAKKRIKLREREERIVTNENLINAIFKVAKKKNYKLTKKSIKKIKVLDKQFEIEYINSRGYTQFVFVKRGA